MPRTKKTESEALASAEPTKRRQAAPKATAVNHKHTTKKSVTPEVAAPARIVKQEEIAELAYSYWVARGYQGGSQEQEEDWFRAEQQLKAQ